MKTGAEAALPDERQTASVTPIRPLPLEDPALESRNRLLRRLVADRLRDLRDDGVTTGYMAKMYDVDPATMDEFITTLGVGLR